MLKRSKKVFSIIPLCLGIAHGMEEQSPWTTTPHEAYQEYMMRREGVKKQVDAYL